MLRPTDLARGAPVHPERVLVGHPFNPPHLVPLVEVVPGEATSPVAVDAAMAFYRLGRPHSAAAARRAPGPPGEPPAGRAVARGVLAGGARGGDGRRRRHRYHRGAGSAVGGAGPVRQPAPLRRRRAASRTSSSTSGPAPRRCGPTSGRPRTPRSSWPASSPASTRPSPGARPPTSSPAGMRSSPPCSPPVERPAGKGVARPILTGPEGARTERRWTASTGRRPRCCVRTSSTAPASSRPCRDRLASASDGHGSVLVLRGEPGTGKTRLLREAVELAHDLGVRVLAGRSVPDRGSVPYRPLTEAFLAAFRSAPRPTSPELAGFGGPPRPPRAGVVRRGAGVDDSPLMMGEAVVRLLRPMGRACSSSRTCTGPTPRRSPSSTTSPTR